jgi:uncharacterized protein
MPLITPLYACALALLFVGLSFRTIYLRHKLDIPLGDGNNRIMLRAIRAHANFSEYVPLVLLLILMVELLHAPSALIHGLGALLCTGRLIHFYGIRQQPESIWFRKIGMAMTFSTIFGSIISIIVLSFTHHV